jgi:hypothetical protein
VGGEGVPVVGALEEADGALEVRYRSVVVVLSAPVFATSQSWRADSVGVVSATNS